MSVTVVHDDDFKPDGDVVDGKAAAAELVELLAGPPGVQLTHWRGSRESAAVILARRETRRVRDRDPDAPDTLYPERRQRDICDMEERRRA